MEENEVIGTFEGQRPDIDEKGSCKVYKSLCDDTIYLCWVNSDDTTCIVEDMSTRLFDKYTEHDLLWAFGTKKPPSTSELPAVVPQSSQNIVEDLTHIDQERPCVVPVEEAHIQIPKRQIDLERTLYHELKDLYSSTNEKKEYEVPYDNETNSNELTVEPFAYPRHNPDCNNIESVNRTRRHDFVVKGSYQKNFKLLYRYDQMGAIAKMFTVQFIIIHRLYY